MVKNLNEKPVIAGFLNKCFPADEAKLARPVLKYTDLSVQSLPSRASFLEHKS
jgi:hypothetical protein